MGPALGIEPARDGGGPGEGRREPWEHREAGRRGPERAGKLARGSCRSWGLPFPSRLPRRGPRRSRLRSSSGALALSFLGLGCVLPSSGA